MPKIIVSPESIEIVLRIWQVSIQLSTWKHRKNVSSRQSPQLTISAAIWAQQTINEFSVHIFTKWPLWMNVPKAAKCDASKYKTNYHFSEKEEDEANFDQSINQKCTAWVIMHYFRGAMCAHTTNWIYYPRIANIACGYCNDTILNFGVEVQQICGLTMQ